MTIRNLMLVVLVWILGVSVVQAQMFEVRNGNVPIGLVMRPIAGAQTNALSLPTPELIGVPPSAQVEFEDFEPELTVRWRDNNGRVVKDTFPYHLILLSHDRGMGYTGRGNRLYISFDRGMLQTVWMTVVLQSDQDPMLSWSATFRATWRKVRLENEAARELWEQGLRKLAPNPAPGERPKLPLPPVAD